MCGANYLASPPLVVAYALAGSVMVDLTTEPLGTDANGEPVYLKDIWPSSKAVAKMVRKAVKKSMFRRRYGNVFEGDEEWQGIEVTGGLTYEWDVKSTYVQEPPYFVDLTHTPKPVTDIVDARILGLFLDSITTDHISPAGAIKRDSPAGRYLTEYGVAPHDFNSYGSRRGNHEVMMRGTFANTRIKNQMLKGIEGGVTLHYPSVEAMSIYDAAMLYGQEGVPTVIFAGKEYGTGSSRDWAAKGPRLLGVRAVIAESFERIHRSNLIGMGILPLVFAEGMSWQSIELSGPETVTLQGLADIKPGQWIEADITYGDGTKRAVPCAPASIRSTSSTISGTAAFCTTCCAASREKPPSPTSSCGPAHAGRNSDHEWPITASALQGEGCHDDGNRNVGPASAGAEHAKRREQHCEIAEHIVARANPGRAHIGVALAIRPQQCE